MSNETFQLPRPDSVKYGHTHFIEVDARPTTRSAIAPMPTAANGNWSVPEATSGAETVGGRGRQLALTAGIAVGAIAAAIFSVVLRVV